MTHRILREKPGEEMGYLEYRWTTKDRSATLRLIEEYDRAVGKSREVLLRLTSDGADPAYILGVLIRFALTKGTNRPPLPRIHLRGATNPPKVKNRQKSVRDVGLPFQLVGADRPVPEGSHPLLWVQFPAPGQRARSKFRARRRPLTNPLRKKSGPAEVFPSVGMALITRHLRRTVGLARYGDTARLFRVWAPWMRGEAYLDGEHVRRRIRDVETDASFKVLVRSETRNWRYGLGPWFKGFTDRVLQRAYSSYTPHPQGQVSQS